MIKFLVALLCLGVTLSFCKAATLERGRLKSLGYLLSAFGMAILFFYFLKVIE
jgi:hypothetical protein